MTWIAYFSLVLVPLTLIDRIAFARRRWWAPVFGLTMQALWIVYGVALGREGIGIWIVAIIVGCTYATSIPKWYRHREKSEI